MNDLPTMAELQARDADELVTLGGEAMGSQQAATDYVDALHRIGKTQPESGARSWQARTPRGECTLFPR